jgi:hypothetical protein
MTARTEMPENPNTMPHYALRGCTIDSSDADEMKPLAR